MTIQLYTQSDAEDIAEQLRAQIVAFNQPFFEVKKRTPLAVTYASKTNEMQGGASGVAFGNWFMLNWLWVDERLRGQKIGQQLLTEIEQQAAKLGCCYILLDTLDFQAKPFYEKCGYRVVHQLNQYPKVGVKYYMQKTLSTNPSS